jgi:RNA polymerase sigma-70 factor (ECF subfamily)
MARAREGDPDAFADIYDRHAGVLLSVARRYLAADEAVDLVHDVFLEAWQHVREYDDRRASARTWLLVRLRSRALDRRARTARGALATHALATHAAQPLSSSPPKVDPMDRRHDLARALGDLDEEVRRVLELTYLEGRTAVEISASEGIPVGTVRSRLARGLDRLRYLLDDGRADG